MLLYSKMSIRLLYGDCLQLMKDISANSVDLIICDLPYGCLTTPKAHPKEWSDFTIKTGKPRTLVRQSVEGCAWDIKIDLQKFWTEAKRILKNDHSPVIHFCTTKFGNELINSNPDWFRYDLVWDKQRGVSFLSANKMPMRSHEMIYVFSKKGAFYNRVDIDEPGKPARKQNHNLIGNVYNTNRIGFKYTSDMPEGKRCVLSVVPVAAAPGLGKHPTEKPCELYRWLIERYCPPDGTVLDPTFGSGNSVFTAQAMGRHAIGIEKDEKFYKKAADKLPRNIIVEQEQEQEQEQAV